MTKAELYQKACMLPLLPGVYIIRDKADEIIYIGKAQGQAAAHPRQPVFPRGGAARQQGQPDDRPRLQL